MSAQKGTLQSDLPVILAITLPLDEDPTGYDIMQFGVYWGRGY